MAFNFKTFWEGIKLFPKSTSTSDSQGDMEVLSTDGKLRYHNGTTNSPVVTEAHSATLTNKTIDADGTGNVISNIDDGNIKAAAAIDATKIANGTVTNTEFQYIGGLTSDAQTQIDSKVTGPASATDNAIVRYDGTTGKLVQNSAVVIDDDGDVSIGNTSGTSRLTVSRQTGVATPFSHATVHISGEDTVLNTLLMDGFAATNTLAGRHSGGTQASPSATVLSSTLLNLAAYGRGDTSYATGSTASINFRAAQNWTDSAQGSQIRILTTQNGTTTAVERMRIHDGGNVSIGSSTSTAKLLVSGQTGVATPFANTVLHVSGADSSATTVSVDAYGSNPAIQMRASAGTQASPSALVNNATLGVIGFSGYGTSAYSSGSRAAILGVASEAWTDSAQGAYLRFDTTATGGTSRTERMRLQNNGNLSIGSTTDSAKLLVAGQSTVPSPITNTTLHVSGPDSATTGISVDAFAASGDLNFRRANGTAASPTALTSGSTIGTMRGYGYGATGYSSGHRAAVEMIAAQTWTDAAQGALLRFSTTQSGTTTLSERMRIHSAGNVDIGTTVGTSKLTVAGQSGVATPPTNTVLHVSGIDATDSRIAVDSYGVANSRLSLRNASGTQASPTASTTSTPLGQIDFIGYGATGYASAARANISAIPSETWTDTAQGTRLRFYTTASGTTSLGERMRIQDSGNVSIGSTTDSSRLLVAGQSGVAAVPAESLLHISGRDGVNSRITVDTYGGSGNIIFRSANGVQATPTAILNNNSLGQVTSFGYGSSSYSVNSAASLTFNAAENWTDLAQGTYIRFLVTAIGGVSQAEKMRLSDDGVINTLQVAPTSVAAAVTLTIAELRTRIIQYTSTGHSLQLPTGTDMQTKTGATTDMSFDFSVINTGSGAAVLTTNTGLTLIGSMSVAATSSGMFRARRTGSNTFTVYRIS